MVYLWNVIGFFSGPLGRVNCSAVSDSEMVLIQANFWPFYFEVLILKQVQTV